MLPQIKTILYATDLREKGCKNAYRFVVAMAKANKAKLVVMHAMEPVNASVAGIIESQVSKDEYSRIKDEALAHLRSNLEEQIKRFCEDELDGEYPCAEPEIEVVEGSAAQSILSLADKHSADLIVMGSRIHSAIGQVLLGSVVNKVIHHSRIPVTVIPL